MPGSPRRNLLVGRIFNKPAHISAGHRRDTWDLFERLFHAPETSTGKSRLVQARRNGSLTHRKEYSTHEHRQEESTTDHVSSMNIHVSLSATESILVSSPYPKALALVSG